jgi:hypothetical protein
LSRLFACTTTAPGGVLSRKKASIASDLRRGFQLAHNSDASARMVGGSSDRLRTLSVCASSIQAMRKPSSDLIDSAVWSMTRSIRWISSSAPSSPFCRGLGGLAPAAIEDRIRRRDPRRGGGVFRAHDADQNIDRRPGMGPRHQTDSVMELGI